MSRNSRALRQLRALDVRSEPVHVFSLRQATPPFPVNLSENIHVHWLQAPDLSGPRFFRRVHELFRSAMESTDADLYHASDLYCLAAARQAAVLRDAVLTYDARELYPFVASTKRRPWVSWFWKFYEARHIKDCDVVFTVSDGIADHLETAYNITRPTVVHNVPETQTVPRTDILRDRLRIPTHAGVILHQGQMRRDRGCLQLVRAAAGLPRAHVVFLGDGPLQPALQIEAAQLEITDRVHFLPTVPSEKLLELTASADVGVTLLEDTCLNHRLALPNKLFEYLMAGLPVLGSDLPEIKGIVTGFDVGLVANPASVSNIRDALLAMLSKNAPIRRWRRNAMSVSETISWEKASHRFLNAIETARLSRHRH